MVFFGRTKGWQEWSEAPARHAPTHSIFKRGEIYWLNPISGSFTNPNYWSGDVVPGASDDAIINAVGNGPYTVAVSTHAMVNSIQTSADAKLSINHGTFFALDGTGSGANAGVILVAGRGKLKAGGQVTNSGSIVLGHGSSGGTLLVSGYLNLDGGGDLLLRGDGQNLIGETGHKSYPALNNIDNTIVGAGTISVFLFNGSSGIVDANGDSPLLFTGNLFNSGLMEATGAGGLIFVNSADQNARPGQPIGIVLAANGSNVAFDGTSVKDGALYTEGSGQIIGYGSYFQDIKNEGMLLIEGRGSDLVGGIANYGTIDIENACALLVSFTLTGDGVVNFGSYGTVFGFDNRSLTFYNDGNTIDGSGSFDAVLKNESDGIIDATGPSGFSFGYSTTNEGTIESTGGNGIRLRCQLQNDGTVLVSTGTIEIGSSNHVYSLANSGTIEASGAGIVVIYSAIVNTGVLSVQAGGTIEIRSNHVYSLANSGTIEASGAGIVVINSDIVNTGVLSVQAGGTLMANGAVNGHGHAIIAGGTLDFVSSFHEAVEFTGETGTLQLAHSRTYNGTVTGFAANGKTTLDLGDIKFVDASEATFSGTASGGVLTVTDGTHTATITLQGDYLNSTFVAAGDGGGGTDVIAVGTQTPSIAHFASVMAASIGRGESAGLIDARSVSEGHQVMLAAPRLALA